MDLLNKAIERKISLEWIFDKIWPFLIVTMGGSATTLLSALTDWIYRIGPVFYAITFLFGALVSATIYLITMKAQKLKIINEHARSALNESSANPLLDKFNSEIVRLSVFYHPYYISHKNKVFDNCQVIGPGNIALMGSTLIRGFFRHCQIVIIKTGPEAIVSNITIFEECSFTNCQFLNCTIFMTQDNYLALDSDVKKYLSVISDAKPI